MIRENRVCGKLEQQGCSLAEVLLEDRRMEHDLLLCGECVELSAELVQIIVDYSGAPACCALEYGMFDKVGYPAVEALFVSRAASYAERAVGYGRAAAPYGILQTAVRLTCHHFLPRYEFMRLMSSARNPGPSFFVILWRRK